MRLPRNKYLYSCRTVHFSGVHVRNRFIPYISKANALPRRPLQELSKYRSKGTLDARTELERDNTEHILDQQARVRVSLDAC